MKQLYLKISKKDWDAIVSLADLAAQSVSDAEQDHMEYKKTTRRNGGYSADLRQFEKCSERVWKQIIES